MEKGNELQHVICVLNPDDVYQITKIGDSKDKPCFVTPYEVKRLKEEQGIIFPQNINEGDVLSLSPDQKSYHVQTEEIEENIISKRLSDIQSIVSLLGGTDYEADANTTEESAKSVNVNVEAGANVEMPDKGVSGQNNTDVKKEKQSKDEKKASTSAEWDGKFTESGYDKAVKLAKESGLINLPVIKDLLEQRHPKHPNPIKRQTYSVDLQSDLASNTKVANRLQADVQASLASFHVSAHVNVNVEKEEKMSKYRKFRFTATFGPVKQDNREIIDIDPITESTNNTIEEKRASTEEQPIFNSTAAELESFKESEIAARQQLAADFSAKMDEQQQSLQDLRLAVDGTSTDLKSFKESEVAARQQLIEEIDEKISDTQQSLKDLHSSLDGTSAALDSFKETEISARQQLKEDVSTKMANQQQSLQDLRLALDGTSADLESFKEKEVAARQQLAEDVNAKYERQQQLIASLQEQLQGVDCALKQLSDEINTYQELMAKQYVRNKKLAIVISSAIGSLSIIGILLSFLL